MKMRTVCTMGVVFAIHAAAWGDASVTNSVEGKWVMTNGSHVLQFLSGGVGREEREGGCAGWFRYSIRDDDAIVVRQVSEGRLRVATLADGMLVFPGTNGNDEVYQRIEVYEPSCALNRLRLQGALAMFIAEQGDLAVISPPDLVPQYLDELPTCPEGGSYAVFPDRVFCSKHGP